MKIGILLGDDIGLEVVPVAVDIMKAAAQKSGLEIDSPASMAGYWDLLDMLPIPAMNRVGPACRPCGKCSTSLPA